MNKHDEFSEYPYDFHKELVKKNEKRKGWECPRCEKINAPTVLSCECIVKDESHSPRLIRLNEGT